jgi:hypothetical protein
LDRFNEAIQNQWAFHEIKLLVLPLRELAAAHAAPAPGWSSSCCSESPRAFAALPGIIRR